MDWVLLDWSLTVFLTVLKAHPESLRLASRRWRRILALMRVLKAGL
jgi:hypothetical protein